MKIKEGFALRKIVDDYILVAQGLQNIDFNKLIRLNESSVYLWNNLEGKEFVVEDMAKLLTDEYDVDEATALKDSQALLEEWIKIGVVE